MINGGVCQYAGGSQLKAAERFIRTHKVKFITLDIGANDVDGCASAGGIDAACVAAGLSSIDTNIPKIAMALRRAAGSKVPIIGMTYYDPFLAAYLEGPSGQAEAGLSVPLARQINQTLAADYGAEQFKVADVATAFDTYTPFTTTTTTTMGPIPVAVAKICALTWMCAPAPVGPNIHANTMGYQTIANVFAAEL
jgi:hypothetical protein